MREYKFIQLYVTVCHHYNNTLVMEAQRQTNNFRLKFTDEEAITTFIWGIYNQKFTVRACYDFIKDFYGDWFPSLPSYQAYSKRINYLAAAFKILADVLLNSLHLTGNHSDFSLDSMPIIVASSKRSSRAKTASQFCDKGYCASKGVYYYGMKLHILAQCNYKAMPTPAQMMTSKASEHDLHIGRELLADVHNIRVFCDMAYADKTWHETLLRENNVKVLTPIKRAKGQETLCYADKLFSRAVSSVKQAIESLNNWLIEKTNIQKASKVRSEAGLMAFVFARVACACFLLGFDC